MWYNFFKTPFVPMTLPESYVNLFTWEEQLRALIKDVYDFVDYVNDNFDDLDMDVDQKIDYAVNNAKNELQTEIAEIRNIVSGIEYNVNTTVNNLRRDVAQTISTIRAEMDSLDNELKTLMRLLESRINDKFTLVYQKIEDTKTYLLGRISSMEITLQRYTDNAVAIERGDRIVADRELFYMINNLQHNLPNIYNPSTGLMGSVGQSICDLYNHVANNGLRVNQIEDNDIPVIYFEDNSISVDFIDLKMGDMIDKEDALRVWSPYTGNRDKIDKVIYDMDKQIAVNNKKVAIFEDNDIKVEDFDNSPFDAYKMGVTHWYNNNPPIELTDLERKSYKLLYTYSDSEQESFDLLVPAYDEYILQVYYTEGSVNNVGSYRYYTVKPNTRCSLAFTDYQKDISSYDTKVTYIKDVLLFNRDSQHKMFRFDTGYISYNDGAQQLFKKIIVTNIYGVDNYTDTLDKED